MKNAPFIKPGSKIRIVSPAGKVKEKLIRPAVEWFKNEGYKVELGKHIFAEHFQFAGTEAQRLEDLQTALDDPDCSAIICSRGGYGTIRIIDQLDFTEFVKHPKWIVGYSDITLLHSAINTLGFASIHGTMPPFFFDESGEVNENLRSLMNLLRGEFGGYKIQGNPRNNVGTVSGELVGGNLSILCSLLGAKYEIDTTEKILFIEEIDEYLYHIDRMIRQLQLAGKFDKLKGLIVGDFTRVRDNDSTFGQTVEEIILTVTKGFDFPVCFGFPAGHDKKNLALPLGKFCKLNVSNKVTTLSLEL
jgi:muramoyltetrapeptide carboxypeptidase